MSRFVGRRSSVVNFCKAVILPLPRLHRSRALSEVEGEGGPPRILTSAGNPSRRILVLITSMLLIATSGCGYHVGGQAAALPSDIRSIAIPAFENRTTSYRLEQVLTSAVVHEFTSRSNYHIAHSADAADATLKGIVTSVQISPYLRFADRASFQRAGHGEYERFVGRARWQKALRESQLQFSPAV